MDDIERVARKIWEVYHPDADWDGDAGPSEKERLRAFRCAKEVILEIKLMQKKKLQNKLEIYFEKVKNIIKSRHITTMSYILNKIHNLSVGDFMIIAEDLVEQGLISTRMKICASGKQKMVIEWLPKYV